MRLLLMAGAAVLLAAAGPGPHDPAVDAAAQAALPRARILPLQARVLDIRGLTSATSGRVVALRDLASDLRAAGLLVSGSDAGLRVTIPDQVLFDFDKAELRADAPAKLAALAKGAATVPELPVVVEGHTDAKGTPAYNQRLSERRAAAVGTWLGSNGVAAARLTTRGYAATRPAAPNTIGGRDDPAGRQRNRRVEVVIGSA